MNCKCLWPVVVACLFSLGAWQAVRAEDLPQRYQDAANKGLAWLAKTQLRDGHWEASGGAYPVAMTGMSGVALLMEGSTLREGKYADNAADRRERRVGVAAQGRDGAYANHDDQRQHDGVLDRCRTVFILQKVPHCVCEFKHLSTLPVSLECSASGRRGAHACATAAGLSKLLKTTSRSLDEQEART